MSTHIHATDRHPGLERAIRFMDENLDQPLTLERIAQTMFVSRFHFARMFRLVTGESPMQYLRRLRVERAKRMMVRGDLTLSEIAAEVGFCDQSHFTRIFRQATGTTPRRFQSIGATVGTRNVPGEYQARI